MNLHPSFPYPLYLVISEKDCRGRDFLQVAEYAIRGGVDMIQLREKEITTKEFVYKALKLKEITDKYHIPLIINDQAEVAEKIKAAGIHVGNQDVAPAVLRPQHSFEHKFIGYSIEYLHQLDDENTAVADYLGVSPIFNTKTKTDTITEWGLSGLAMIRSRTDKPLVAIGNVRLENASAIVKAGADSLAVVSAICGADHPEQAAYAIKNELLK